MQRLLIFSLACLAASLVHADPDLCNPNPCENGGFCGADDAGHFRCLCPVDYMGLTCRIYIDLCSPNPCRNRGRCTRVGPASTICQCLEDLTGITDFSGSVCQDRANPCEPDPCENGGVCIAQLGAKDFTCHCPDAYKGVTCQTRVDHCVDHPCINGGQCVNVSAITSVCRCPIDYTGFLCQRNDGPVPVPDLCNPNPCANGGLCGTDNAGHSRCQCPVDYMGLTCRIYIDLCSPSPCRNGGRCTRVGPASTICQCPKDVTGSVCQHRGNPCEPDPCENGGVCVAQLGAKDFKCHCPASFKGVTCQTGVDHCVDHPCINGGQCVNVSAVTSVCRCPIDYTGFLCQRYVNPCQPDPCENGGRCTRDGLSEFTCHCLDDFQGERCQEYDEHPSTSGRCSVSYYSELTSFAVEHPSTSGRCSVSYYSELTSFAGEQAPITIPCNYKLAHIACGRFTLQVTGSSVDRCKKTSPIGRCLKKHRAYALSHLNVTIQHGGQVWSQNFNLSDYLFNGGDVTYDGVDFNVFSDDVNKKFRVVTTDGVMMLSFSQKEGVVISCSRMTMSKGYPLTLCGNGRDKPMEERTRRLGLNETFNTVVFDILNHRDVIQTISDCSIAATQAAPCLDSDTIPPGCIRCFGTRYQHTRIPCLARCLPKSPQSGKCPGLPDAWA